MPTISSVRGTIPWPEIINEPEHAAGPQGPSTLFGTGGGECSRRHNNGGQGSKKEIAVRGAYSPDGYLACEKRLAQLEKAQDDDENSWNPRKGAQSQGMPAPSRRYNADYFGQYIAAWKRFC